MEIILPSIFCIIIYPPVQKNLIRVAETWMDSLKKFFYASTRVYPFKRATLNEEEMKSLQERKELRKRLKCQNFEW